MLPAINVPQEVLERLKEDEEKRLEAGNEVMLSRGHSSNRNGEEILFWEPPLFARGFFNLENFILGIVFTTFHFSSFYMLRLIIFHNLVI